MSIAKTSPTAAKLRHHIFLSFASEERVAAARLKDALVAVGYNVWWQVDLQVGSEWHGAIDKALKEAGCVIVLWSNMSLQSQWVRHEASQAIARGVYAPARLEPMVIDSPYDRIQATDLFNWDGDAKYPGFISLVRRIEELLPPPIPPQNKPCCF